MRKKDFRRVKGILMGIFLLSLFLSTAPLTSAEGADDFPSKPIIINVGSTPGSPYGICSQVFIDQAKKHFKNPQTILINFKPGGAGTVAADYVLKQPADGYNIALISIDLVAKFAESAKSLPFTRDDFAFIGTMATSPLLASVRTERPWNTIEELNDYAKKNPGKLSYCSLGIGGGSHLVAEIWQMKCGIKLNHIPFTGGPPGVTAVLGGHVDISTLSFGTTGPHIKSGALKVLGVFADERFDLVPNVPTFLERGFDVQYAAWAHLAVPKATPKPVVDELRRVFSKTMAEPATKEGFWKMGFRPLNLGPEETRKVIDKNFELSDAVYRKLGMVH